MSPLEALNDVCRHFCTIDRHDDACITLRGVVNEWAASRIYEGVPDAE